MRPFVYDAEVLVAADRNDSKTWSRHRTHMALGAIPLVPAPVVAQVSRSPKQAQLRRFLAGCRIVPFGEAEAHEVGRLLALTKMTDTVDGFVVVVARKNSGVIFTSDREDIERLVSASEGDVYVAGA